MEFIQQNKIFVINSLINLIELKCPNWRNNKSLEAYRSHCLYVDNIIKKSSKYLNDEKRCETDSLTIIENINKTLKRK